MGLKSLLNLASYIDEKDRLNIKKAYLFAEKYHQTQLRKSGEPYMTHLESVAIILLNLKQQLITIQVGLLHDILEDTECSEEKLESEFGKTILELVNGVTKLNKINFPSNIDQQAENYRKLFIAMAKDIRIIIIKLADRLHNMRTIHFLSLTKQRRIAKETLEVYVPLAHRLGMAQIKWELEDFSFATLHREDFNHIKKLIRQKRDKRESLIESVSISFKEVLKEHQVYAEVSGRPKHFYSIYKKLSEDNIEFSQLFDLYGIRIITDSIQNCYLILGIVHSKYRPIDGRLKDYIALPKSNMYQSLHTAVIGPNGNRIEIQIRTKEMHEISEYGIAAHWRYKEKEIGDKRLDFSWLRQILEDQKQTAEYFIENLKMNLYNDEVFIFTPQGDIIVLPKGATILDAAFKIHTDIGLKFKSGIVNGKIVPINYILKNGDQINIQTKKIMQPNLGWLDVVKTRFSKIRIKSFFKKQDKDIKIKLGDSKLRKILIKYGFIKTKKEAISQFLDRIKIKLKYNHHQDILIAIANNEISTKMVAKCCRVEDEKTSAELIFESKKIKKIKQSLVCIDGECDIETYISKCCQPLPGDPIVGYITKGFGIAIHHRHCKDLKNFIKQSRHRITPASWVYQSQNIYSTDIQLVVIDRPALLKDILELFSKYHINISKASTKVYKNGQAKINLTCDISKYDEFIQIQQELMKFEDILYVNRAI